MSLPTACIHEGGVGAGVRLAWPEASRVSREAIRVNFDAFLHVVQSTWFLYFFQMAFNRAKSIQPILSEKDRGYLGNKRLQA